MIELQSMHSKDPRAYMNLVKALRDNKHDRSKPSDLQEIQPDTWFEHFSSLLGKKIDKSETEIQMEDYIKCNIDNLCSELDEPFSKTELLVCIKNLKNNKASAFDMINNEMLKLSYLAQTNIIAIRHHLNIHVPKKWLFYVMCLKVQLLVKPS